MDDPTITTSPTTIGDNAKATYSNPDAGFGFDQLGWSPEGQVYFNYSVDTSGNNYTAAAVANIDASGNGQTWGYTTSKTLAAKAHARGTCDVTNAKVIVKTVGPCDSVSGQSVF